MTWKRALIYICLLICGAVLWSIIPKCNVEPVFNEYKHITDSLKTELQKEFKKKDSVKKEVVYRDSIRKIIVYKYRSDKSKSKTAPCDSILPIIISDCDTIIRVDSSLIASLKNEIRFDSLIIDDQSKIIKLDSVHIEALERKLKRAKWHRRLLAMLAGGLGIIAISK